MTKSAQLDEDTQKLEPGHLDIDQRDVNKVRHVYVTADVTPSIDTIPETRITHDEAGACPNSSAKDNATKVVSDGELNRRPQREGSFSR